MVKYMVVILSLSFILSFVTFHVVIIVYNLLGWILNLCLILSGSNIHSSSKIYTPSLRDFGSYTVEEYAVVNDNTVYLGHILLDNELRFGDATIEKFAYTHIIFAGSCLPANSMGASWMVITTRPPKRAAILSPT